MEELQLVDAHVALEEAMAAAARLPGDQSLALSGSEDSVRAVAALPGAVLFGQVIAGDRPNSTIWWTASAARGRVRVMACFHRAATPRELSAASEWFRLPGEQVIRGKLRRWVEGAVS